MHINRALREAGCSRCARSSGASCSTPAPPRPSPSPTTRSRTSTCGGRERVAEVKRAARAAADGVETRARRGGQARRTASTTRARASSSRSARADRWFTYYYWLDDARAPDFARTVDIHRKPGYDPVELFLDPDAPRCRRLKVGWTLAQEGARLPLPDGRDPARRRLVQGLARPRSPTTSATGPLVHLERGRAAAPRADRRDRGQGAHPRPRVRADAPVPTGALLQEQVGLQAAVLQSVPQRLSIDRGPHRGCLKGSGPVRSRGDRLHHLVAASVSDAPAARASDLWRAPVRRRAARRRSPR